MTTHTNTPTTHTQHHNTHEYSPVAINTEDHTSSATVVVGDFLVAIGSSEARLPISGTSPIRFHSDMFGINSEMIRSARVRLGAQWFLAPVRVRSCISRTPSITQERPTPCSRSLMWFATDDILAELSLGRSCDSPLKGGAEEMELPSCPRPRRRPRCPRGSARALLAGSRVGTKTRIVPEPLNFHRPARSLGQRGASDM